MEKNIYYIDLLKTDFTFRVFGQFDREQHKCDPQMNNTRGLIYVYINSIIKLDMNISHFCHNIMVQLVLLQ